MRRTQAYQKESDVTRRKQTYPKAPDVTRRTQTCHVSEGTRRDQKDSDGEVLASCIVVVVVDEPEPSLAQTLALAVCEGGALGELVRHVHGDGRLGLRQGVHVLRGRSEGGSAGDRWEIGGRSAGGQRDLGGRSVGGRPLTCTKKVWPLRKRESGRTPSRRGVPERKRSARRIFSVERRTRARTAALTTPTTARQHAQHRPSQRAAHLRRCHGMRGRLGARLCRRACGTAAGRASPW